MPRQECRKVPKEFSTFQTVQECGNVNKDICRPVPRCVEHGKSLLICLIIIIILSIICYNFIFWSAFHYGFFEWFI